MSGNITYNFNNQGNTGRMVGAPIHGGTVTLGDTYNYAQNHPQTTGPNLSKEDQERHKAFEEFFKKYLAKDAIQKLPSKPYKIKTGKMLIINNEKWPNNPNCDRDGTNLDRDALMALSKHIDFGEAIVKENRTVKQMKDDLNKFATEQNWKNLDAAIVCVMSHGGENNVIYGTGNMDEKLEMAELLHAFSQQTGNCQYLQGKPKIFIIQACRGKKFDNRAAASDGANMGESDKIEFESAESLFNSAYAFFADAVPSQESKADSNYKSQAADVLVLWATGWDFLAWRNTRSGSYFIEELTKAIMDNSEELHMVELMEHVIKAVKGRFQAGKYKAGECPQFLSSLDRKLYLM